jgi:hypothetical protein
LKHRAVQIPVNGSAECHLLAILTPHETPAHSTGESGEQSGDLARRCAPIGTSVFTTTQRQPTIT